MGAIETLGRWLEPPAIDRVVYRCLDCDLQLGPEESSCSECGGEVTERREPIEYAYWSPYY